jgi:hypothetical protein
MPSPRPCLLLTCERPQAPGPPVPALCRCNDPSLERKDSPLECMHAPLESTREKRKAREAMSGGLQPTTRLTPRWAEAHPTMLRLALFILNMPCSICGEPLRVGDDIVATTHFIGDATDHLWRFSDSVMHRSCFDSWAHRDEFARRYRETMGSMYPHCADYVGWPGPPGKNIVKAPPPPAPPPPPSHFCPRCNAALSVGLQSECKQCGWLRYPSDRSSWGAAGACPTCGFSYRYDGARCSHCGGQSAK